jgi:hypothetical protein
MILYDEYNWGDVTTCVVFFVGLAVTFFGVYLVGKKEQGKHGSRERLLDESQSIEVSIAEYSEESVGPSAADGGRAQMYVLCACLTTQLVFLSSRMCLHQLFQGIDGVKRELGIHERILSCSSKARRDTGKSCWQGNC